MATDQDIAAALLAMRQRHPDWRIGQLVCNVATMARGCSVGAVWDMEDDEFVETIQAHVLQRREKSTHDTNA